MRRFLTLLAFALTTASLLTSMLYLESYGYGGSDCFCSVWKPCPAGSAFPSIECSITEADKCIGNCSCKPGDSGYKTYVKCDCTDPEKHFFRRCGKGLVE